MDLRNSLKPTKNRDKERDKERSDTSRSTSHARIEASAKARDVSDRAVASDGVDAAAKIPEFAGLAMPLKNRRFTNHEV
jgi:hypothetical protein